MSTVVDARHNSTTVAPLAFPRVRDSSGSGQKLRGPNTTTLTTTNNAVIVADPGDGLSIYVTHIKAGNASSSLTRLDIVEGGSLGDTSGTVVDSQPLAALGGGYVTTFTPAYQVAASTVLHARLSTGVTDVRVNVHFFVAP